MLLLNKTSIKPKRHITILIKQNYIKMESSNETDVKNRTCYHFDDIININDLDFDQILLDKKPWENILMYD